MRGKSSSTEISLALKDLDAVRITFGVYWRLLLHSFVFSYVSIAPHLHADPC